MTGLLVSVRSEQEARIALECGADLIDVKEPSHGSLGAASSQVLRQIATHLSGRVPISAALGELADQHRAALPDDILAHYDYVKLGMAGCAQTPDWLAKWAAAVESLPQAVAPVAVIYADWQAAQAPPPRLIVNHARQLGCAAVLVDTYDKSRGGLLDHFCPAKLSRLMTMVQENNMLIVLAGSLSLTSLPAVLEFSPDYVAVRGAACRQSRTGPIDGKRVRHLSRLIAGFVRPVID